VRMKKTTRRYRSRSYKYSHTLSHTRHAYNNTFALQEMKMLDYTYVPGEDPEEDEGDVDEDEDDEEEVNAHWQYMYSH